MREKKVKANNLRKSGLSLLGDIAWGTHFCQFYSTKTDLLDILVPYFKAGLKGNEFCTWITSEPLGVEDAKQAMLKAMPDFDNYLKKGQIKIIPHTQWYIRGGKFNQQRVLNGWVNKLKRARKHGYAGLRLTGNTFWLEKKDWRKFADYEEAVNNVIGKYQMLAICTYSLEKCQAAEIVDVINNHQFALIKEAGRWTMLENSAHRKGGEALLENEIRLNKAQEIAHLGSWELDLVSDKLFWSDETYRIFGLKPQEFKATYEAFLAAVHPEDRQAVNAAYTASLREGINSYEIEHRVVRKSSGEVRIVHEKCEHIRDKTGRIIRSVGMVHDITERKRAEEECERLLDDFHLNEQRLRWALAAGNSGAWDWDLLNNTAWWSREMYKLWGVKPGTPMKTKNSLAIIDVRDRQCVRDRVQEYVKNHTNLEYEFRIQHAQLGERWMATRGRIIYNGAGEAVRVIGITQDITERKRTEEKIHHLASFPQFNPNPVIELDANGKIIFSNAAAIKTLDQLGVPKKLELFLPQDISQIRAQLHSGVKATFTREVRIKDAFFIETVTVIPELKVVRIYTLDITLRKRAEDAFKQSQRRFISNIELTGQIPWTTNAKGQATEDVPAWRKYTGQSYEGIKGSGWTNALHPDDLQHTLKVWNNAVTTKTKYETEYRVRKDDGTYRYFLARGIPLFDEKNNIKEWIGTCIDITAQKEIERQLQEAHDKLELKVAQRTEELARSNKQLTNEILERKEIENKLYLRGAILKIMGKTFARKEFLDAMVKLIKGITRCRCIGIRVLNEHGEIPYESYVGFSKEFWQSENRLCVDTDQCACIRVITQKPLPQDVQAMTKGGSFRCDDSIRFIQGLKEEEKSQFRGVCIASGFLSLAIIPIVYKNEILASIQLADETKDKVPLKTIELIEFLGQVIGEALHRFNLEDRIRLDHATLEAFFNNTITPLAFLDKEFNFIRVNKAYADACAKDISEFPGHNHFEYYPDAENEAIFRNVLHSKTAYQVFAKPFVFPDHPEWGTTYWDWALTPLFDEKGEIYMLIFSLKDVTERKRNEEKLMRAQKELDNARRLSDIGTLAATVAHELRNPLAAIRMASFNIRRKAQNPLLEKHFINIEKKISESDQIINNLLFYSRIKQPHYEEVNLYQVMEECVEIAKKRHVGQQVQVKKEYRVLNRAPFAADPLQMKELFSNILNNAFDAMSGNPGTILIGARNDNSETVEVSIQDTGVGMDKEHLRMVYEPFFTTKAKGTGLGLTVCFQIAHLHRGKIQLVSEKGKGTTVTVVLPAKNNGQNDA